MHGASLRPYIGAGIPIFHSSVHSFIFLSRFPHLRVYISVSPSLNLSPYIHLACHLYLPRRIYLPLYRSKRKIIQKGDVQHTILSIFLFDREIRLLIFLYLAETKIHWIKDDGKINDKRASVAMVQDRKTTYAIFPNPLGSHYRLPLRFT